MEWINHTEIDESETILAKIIEYKGKLESILQPSRLGVTEIVPANSGSEIISSAHAAKFCLPKLTLPKFCGDVTLWTSFWDSFKAAIHDNPDLNKIDKFNYLTSVLEGAAAHSIQGLTLSGVNYDNAVELLKQRFGRPQQITAHMDSLLKIQSCTGDRPATLRFVYDRINVHVRGLHSLGVCSDQYGSLLIPVIMSKLPNDIRLRIARETTSEVWKMDELLDVIKAEVEAREASEGTKVNASNRPQQVFNHKNTNKQSSSSHPTMDSFFTNTRGLLCVHCNGNHYSASCDKVESLQDHKDIMIKTGRCFNCLKTNHKFKDYTNPCNCRNCHRRHHQSICSQMTKGEKRKLQILILMILLLSLIPMLPTQLEVTSTSFCKLHKLLC